MRKRVKIAGKMIKSDTFLFLVRREAQCILPEQVEIICLWALTSDPYDLFEFTKRHGEMCPCYFVKRPESDVWVFLDYLPIRVQEELFDTPDEETERAPWLT